MAKILTWIATLGPLGYLPAPGTMGTIAAMPLAFTISCMAFHWQIITIALMCGISYLVIDRALPYFKNSDPSEIVIDELVGTLVTFCAIPCNSYMMLVGFILFRSFDIFKPCGISWLEKIPGSPGILLDDIAAGLLAHLILRLLFV